MVSRIFHTAKLEAIHNIASITDYKKLSDRCLNVRNSIAKIENGLQIPAGGEKNGLRVVGAIYHIIWVLSILACIFTDSGGNVSRIGRSVYVFLIVTELMSSLGILGDLPESNQISLFDFAM